MGRVRAVAAQIAAPQPLRVVLVANRGEIAVPADELLVKTGIFHIFAFFLLNRSLRAASKATIFTFSVFSFSAVTLVLVFIKKAYYFTRDGF